MSAATTRRPPMPDRALRQLLQDCWHLLSERGEANGPGIAGTIVQQIDALADDNRTRFFDHLARDFSPNPQQVLAAALAYAKAPSQSATQPARPAARPGRPGRTRPPRGA